MKAKVIHWLLAVLMCILSLSVARGEEAVKVLSMSPDRASKVYGNLSLIWTEQQKLYVYNGLLKINRVIVQAPFRFRPEIRWYGNRYVEVVVGTGSPGNYSVFYDVKKDIVSEKQWFVVAFDKRRGIAVLGQDRIIVVDVFENKELLEIKPSDLPVTAVTFLVIEKCSFNQNGDIRLVYTNNKNKTKLYIVKSKEPLK